MRKELGRDRYPMDKKDRSRATGPIAHDEVIPVYVMLLFLLFLIGMISMWQSRRINLCMEEIEALKSQQVSITATDGAKTQVARQARQGDGRLCKN